MALIFTPEEANRLLPQVRLLVTRMVELKMEIDSSSGQRRNQSVDELGVIISKIESMGVELKDLDSGLVDFPAERFGEKVYLCWRRGEREVLHWHNLTEGFRGRKPVKPELAQIR